MNFSQPRFSKWQYFWVAYQVQSLRWSARPDPKFFRGTWRLCQHHSQLSNQTKNALAVSWIWMDWLSKAVQVFWHSYFNACAVLLHLRQEASLHCSAIKSLATKLGQSYSSLTEFLLYSESHEAQHLPVLSPSTVMCVVPATRDQPCCLAIAKVHVGERVSHLSRSCFAPRGTVTSETLSPIMYEDTLVTEKPSPSPLCTWTIMLTCLELHRCVPEAFQVFTSS